MPGVKTGRLEDWKAGSQGRPRVCGFGSVALRLRGFGASGLRGWRFASVDIYAGKGIIGVGDYIFFPFCCILIINADLREVVNLEADVSVDGL